MSEDSSPDGQRLYVHVKDWQKHQPRSDRPNLPWIRLETALLGNDAWLELSTPDRCLLICIWMLSQRYGNGHLLADEKWLKGQAKAHKSSLTRLVQAGFLTLSTTKGEPVRFPKGGLEEKRVEKVVTSTDSLRSSVSSPPIAAARKSRPRDLIWDAFIEGCGYEPGTSVERGAWNKSCKEVRDKEPSEVLAKASAFKLRYPQIRCTPTAIVRQWGALAEINGRPPKMSMEEVNRIYEQHHLPEGAS